MIPFPLLRIDADADDLHVAGPDEWWREAWYFEFYDPRSWLQFQAYQGAFPNRGMGDLTAAFFHERRPLHQTMKMDYMLSAERIEERLCFGPLKLEMVEPFARWRLRYDAPDLAADLQFEALHAPYSWAESRHFMEHAEDHAQRSQHFDQFGRYRGTVWAGESVLAVDALGFRDRMWGWGARRHWTSYVVLWSGFGEDFVTNLSIQNFADGTPSLCGYIYRDTERSLLHHARVEIEWDPRHWRTVKTITARMKDMMGRSAVVTGHPMGICDTSHHWKHRSDHMLFSVGEYACAGRTGYGVMNWAFRSEALRPVAMEAALLERHPARAAGGSQA